MSTKDQLQKQIKRDIFRLDLFGFLYTCMAFLVLLVHWYEWAIIWTILGIMFFFGAFFLNKQLEKLLREGKKSGTPE